MKRRTSVRRSLGSIIPLVVLGIAGCEPGEPTAPAEEVQPRLLTQLSLEVSAAGGVCEAQYPNAVTWYVKSGAPAAVATGDKNKPFASLADAEAVSGPGDAIMVLHVPADVAALDGGITLKDCQELLGNGPSVTTASPEAARSKITNSAGDAVAVIGYVVYSRVGDGQVHGGSVKAHRHDGGIAPTEENARSVDVMDDVSVRYGRSLAASAG